MDKPSEPRTIVRTGLLIPDLEEGLFEQIARTKAANPLAPLLVVVGSRFVAFYLTRKFAERGANLYDVRFVPLTEITRFVSQPFSFARYLTLRNSIAVATEPADPFGGSAKFPGFTRSLLRSFRELEEAGLESLDSFPFSAGNSTDEARWNSLKGLFRHYSRKKDEGASMPEWFLQTYGVEQVSFYGIYDVNGQQWKLLRELCERIQNTWYVPYHPQRTAFQPVYQFAHRLIERLRIAFQAEIQPLRSAGFANLSTQVFLQQPPSPYQGRQVSVERVDDCLQEADRIAGRIAGLVVNNGVRPTEIAVILWQSSPYRALIIDAVKRSGLPVADGIGRSLAETRAARAVLELLTFNPARLSRRKLMDTIAGGGLKIEGLGERFHYGNIENATVQTGIVEGSIPFWIERLGLRAPGEELGAVRLAAEALAAFLAKIKPVLTQFASVKESQQAFQLLAEALSDLLAKTGGSDELAVFIREQATLPSIPTNPADFLDAFRYSLTDRKVDATLSLETGVALLTPLQARGIGFKAVFLPGMVAGGVPASYGGDPFVTDDVRFRMNHLINGEESWPLRTTAARQEEERLLFGLAIDSATESIYLSYPASKLDTGAETNPSRYLVEVCRALAGRNVSGDEVASGGSREVFKQDALAALVADPADYSRAAIKHNFPPKEQSAAFRSLLRVANPEALEAAESVSQPDRRNECAPIAARDGRALFSVEPSIAVTDIEKYARCPYQFLVQSIYMLDAFPDREAQIEPPPQVSGVVIHRAIEAILRLGEGKLLLPESNSLERDVRASIRGQDAFIRTKWSAAEASYDLAKRQWELKALGALKWLGSAFASGSAIEIEKTILGRFDGLEESALLSGRIDLIVVESDRLSIIDFKTGASPANPRTIGSGEHLQLPVYLGLLLASRGIPPERGRALYLHLDARGQPKALSVDGEWVQQNRTEINHTIGTLLSGLRAGLYPALPSKKEHCRSCSVQSVCDIRSRITEKDFCPSDPTVAAIRAMSWKAE